MTIREIVYDIGGGPVGKAQIKAVQTGGPSGGCIPCGLFDLPIDYDSLGAGRLDHGLGRHDRHGREHLHGGCRQVLHELPQGRVVREVLHLPQRHPADVRNPRRHLHGRGRSNIWHCSRSSALVVKDTTMCGLGQTASNPVLSTLRYFRDEYKRTSCDKRCDAYVCKDLSVPPARRPAHGHRGVALRGAAGARRVRRLLPVPSARPTPSRRICAGVRPQVRTAMPARDHGGQPVAIRALKRFVTDRVDPSVYKPSAARRPVMDDAKVAVVGSGPAGLTAAHYLSLDGYKVTLFEAQDVPAACSSVAFRPTVSRGDVLRKEIDVAAQREHYRPVRAPRWAATSPSTACSPTVSRRCSWPSAPTRAGS